MLICVGDSINAAEGAWREMVSAVVINRSVSGSKVRDLPTQMDDTHAETAVVSIGVNDVLDLGRELELDVFEGCLVDLAARCDRVLLLPVLLCWSLHPQQYRAELRRRTALVSGALLVTSIPIIDYRLPDTRRHPPSAPRPCAHRQSR